MSPPTEIVCPIPQCRKPNNLESETCQACGTPLREYARLVNHSARLFNNGLDAASDSRLDEAIESFAAVVHWCPSDLDARNALAQAYFESDNDRAARRHWDQVLERKSKNEIALKGLELLAQRAEKKKAGKKTKKKKTRKKGAKNTAKKKTAMRKRRKKI